MLFQEIHIPIIVLKMSDFVCFVGGSLLGWNIGDDHLLGKNVDQY